MQFIVTIDCGNDAFGHAPAYEIARILHELEKRLRLECQRDIPDVITLHDYNGNRVGSAVTVPESESE